MLSDFLNSINNADQEFDLNSFFNIILPRTFGACLRSITLVVSRDSAYPKHRFVFALATQNVQKKECKEALASRSKETIVLKRLMHRTIKSNP